jgi:DNA-binding MarR family transcriptional regulator
MTASNQFLSLMHEWTGVFMRHSMRNFLLFSKEKGISMPQIGALYRIRKGECSVSDISGELSITNAAASQMLESLVQQDFIRRSEDPHDRRAKQIVLTDKGRKILLEGVHARQAWMHHLVHHLTPQEQAQITSALRILVGKANELEKKYQAAGDSEHSREKNSSKGAKQP